MSVEKPLLLVVACALVKDKPEDKGAGGVRVLLARRPEGKSLAGLWEFPGGKLERGESPEQALRRELCEELAIDVDESDLQPLCFASHVYEKFHLLMPLYLSRRFRGVPKSCEGQILQWVKLEHLAEDYRIYSRVRSAAAGRKDGSQALFPDEFSENTAQNGRYPLPPADIPLIPALIRALSG